MVAIFKRCFVEALLNISETLNSYFVDQPSTFVLNLDSALIQDMNIVCLHFDRDIWSFCNYLSLFVLGY